MKKILLAIVFITVGFFAKSQSLELYTENDVLINSGDTITVDSLPTVNEMVAHIKVKNITAGTLSVTCEKEYVYIVSGTTNTFCWAGACYPEATMTSANMASIAAGATTNEFSGHYEPKNHNGTSVIKYYFRVYHGPSVEVNVKYAGLTGIAENKLSSSISTPYPNPAKTTTRVNYNVSINSKASIQVYNITGKLEKQVNLTDNNGFINLNVADLQSGIYFCTLNINGKVAKTNRLVVSH